MMEPIWQSIYQCYLTVLTTFNKGFSTYVNKTALDYDGCGACPLLNSLPNGGSKKGGMAFMV